MKRRFNTNDFEGYSKDVVTIKDVKSIVRDYIQIWGKEELEKEVGRWFEKINDDEG